MSRIYWDTMLFVYWLEDHPRYAKRLRQVLRTIKERHDHLYTSSFALAEVLVGRYKTGALKTARDIREVIRPPAVEVIPWRGNLRFLYWQIRATMGVSPANAPFTRGAQHRPALTCF